MLQAAAFLVSVAAIASLFESFGWPWELPAHFRPQIALLLAVATLIALVFRRWRQAALPGILCGVLAGLLVHTRVVVATPLAQAGRGVVRRCCSYNVHTANRNFEGVRTWLREQAFDVVFLLETDGRWVEELGPLRDVYPYMLTEPREDNFGITLLARGLPAAGRVVTPGAAELPSIEVTFDDGLRLIGTHPLPPGRQETVDYRDDQLEALAALVACGGDVVVAGDLNCTPWSHAFVRFVRSSGLQDTSPRWQPTWPSFWPLPMRVPIDHALISTTLVCTARSLGPDLGSDHLPIVFSIARK